MAGSPSVGAVPELASAWSRSLAAPPSAPSVQGGAVFVTQSEGVLALKVRNGQQFWRRDLSGILPATADPTRRPVPLSIFPPQPAGSLLLIGMSRGDRGHLLALDLHTGRTRWDVDTSAATSLPATGGAVLSVPRVCGDRVIARTGRGLTALRLTDGKALWGVEMDRTLPVPSAPSAPPACDGRAIYFNADFGVAYAFSVRDGRLLWRTPTLGIEDRAGASVRQVAMTFTYCAPLRVAERLVIADGLGDVYALRAADGAVLWRATPGYSTRLAAAGQSVYVTTVTGFFELDLRTGKVRRRRLAPGGFYSCTIVHNLVVLAGADRGHAGWEIFDLKRWQPLRREDGFTARYGVTYAAGMVFLAGYPPPTVSQSAGLKVPELRAYGLTSAQLTGLYYRWRSALSSSDGPTVSISPRQFRASSASVQACCPSDGSAR